MHCQICKVTVDKQDHFLEATDNPRALCCFCADRNRSVSRNPHLWDGRHVWVRGDAGICPHGGLRRTCDSCELIAAQAQILALEEGIRLYRINFHHEDISDEACWADASSAVLAWEERYGKEIS